MENVSIIDKIQLQNLTEVQAGNVYSGSRWKGNLKGESAMIKGLLNSVLMLIMMAAPAPILLLLQLSTTSVQAGDLHEWSVSMLFKPTPLQLQQERAGRVHRHHDL